MTESIPPPPGAISTTGSVLSKLEAYADPKKAELQKRQVGMRSYIEKRVLAPEALSNKVNLEGGFDDLTPRERADLLYEKLMSRDQALKAIQEEQKSNPDVVPEPIDTYLTSEVAALWSDPETQEVFLQRYSEARMDAKAYRLSELGGEYATVNQAIADVEGQYGGLSKELFLGQVTRPDKLSSARGKASALAKRLIELRDKQQHIIDLEDVPHIPENTDVASMIMYDTLTKYHSEAQTGFVWLPSRTELLETIKQSLQNGRWPWLEGEAGTGKSDLADAAAVQLTGNEPTHIPCTSRTNAGNIISDKDIAGQNEGGGSFLTYMPLLQAATGYENSQQPTPPFPTGRIARFDEAGRLPSDSPAYAIIKEARQLKPGDVWYGKKVLRGFGSIFTSNPVGPRYPDRHEPDPAMRRELSKINVDYPPMSAQDPELYEFMLSTLIDENRHIAVSGNELAPAYIRQNVSNGETLPDGRKVIATEELVEDSTDARHGTLYRLSYAVRELQNAFNYGNVGSIPDTALRFRTDARKIVIDKNGTGEPLTLSTSTITLGEVASWMRGFNERTLKDDPNFQTRNLTEFIQLKLKLYLDQADPDDREKIRALFDHFHLFEPRQVPVVSAPLTPKDIGYLSPRVPRPAILSETQHTILDKPLMENKTPAKYQDMSVVFEDGGSRLVTTSPMEIDKKGKKTSVKSGTSFILDGQKYKYIGYFEGKVVVDTGEGLHRLIDPGNVWEKGVFIESVAKEQFGADFIGEEAIRAMEDQCRQAGIEAHFSTDNVDLSYAVETLEEAGKEKSTDRERFLVMRPSGVKFKDNQGEYDGPITIQALKRLFQDKNPFGDGTLIYDNSWYEGEAFIDQPLQAKYAMPTKKLLPESRSKNWADQEKLLKPGETRREAIETLWDTIAYYSATKQRLLSDGYDWSKTSTSDGYRVCVGDFDQRGVRVGYDGPRRSDSYLGVCPAK